jgi:hypothetical protein
MRPDPSKLVKKALKLSTEARTALATSLLVSLEWPGIALALSSPEDRVGRETAEVILLP